MTDSDDYVWYFARTFEGAHDWLIEVDEVGVAELERRWEGGGRLRFERGRGSPSIQTPRIDPRLTRDI